MNSVLSVVAALSGVFTAVNPAFAQNWMQSGAPSDAWSSVASSADGNKLAAASPGGGIYTWQTTPTPLLRIMPSDSGVLLSWTIPSMDFTLQQNSDLTGTSWTDVTTLPVLNLTNLQNEVVVPLLSAGNRFYRLKY
jgi:hypothetical protein